MPRRALRLTVAAQTHERINAVKNNRCEHLFES